MWKNRGRCTLRFELPSLSPPRKLTRERKGKGFHLRLCSGSRTAGCTCPQFEQAWWTAWHLHTPGAVVSVLANWGTHWGVSLDLQKWFVNLFFFLIKFYFLFLSKRGMLGDLRQPGRKAARFLSVFWQRFAETFLQNLFVFLQHCWVALTNSQFLAFLTAVCGYPDPYGNAEGKYTHLRVGSVILSGYWQGAFPAEKALMSPVMSSSLLGAGWP